MSASKKINALKYLAIFTAPFFALISLYGYGWWTYATAFYIFGFVPIGDMIFRGSEENFSKAEEEMVKADKFYDYLIYSIVPCQYLLLVIFLFQVNEPGLSTFETIGRITAMGLMCVSLGINVAHELGHRRSKFEQFLSKSLLLSTLYLHFFIEHNQGHHKNVSTPDDPASAKKWDILYLFLVKSVVFSYISAWKIEANNMKRKGFRFFSLKNEMIVYTIIQIVFLSIICFFFGKLVTFYFICAASLGFLLLETVNYVEHYGLSRNKVEGKHHYEKVQPIHSWNSNHYLGRILLFELTRHSDHHADASRKYQVLRHFEEAPQMPLGYPGMILLSFFPPLFFIMVHPIIDRFEKEKKAFYASV